MAAYYAVIRELIVGLHSRCASFDDITQALGLAPEDLQCMAAHIACEPVLCAQNSSDFLRALASDMHDNTWFFLTGDNRLIGTHRGTRPGGCLADVTFSLLFAAVLRRARAHPEAVPRHRVFWDGQKNLQAAEQRFHGDHAVSLEEVIYADDLAFFDVVEMACDILATTTLSARVLLETFHSHGLRANFGKTKTATIIAANGKGCRSVRQRIYHGLGAKLPVLMEHSASVALDVVPCYKHLGAIIHFSGSLREEILTRLHQARAAFRDGKREVYANRTIPLARRVLLFQSNVLSVAVHGAGAWPSLTEGEFSLFQQGIMSLFRQVLAIPAQADQHWSSESILAATRLPSPQVLLHVERLRFLRLLLTSGPTALWALIKHDGLFLMAMREATRWLYEVCSATMTMGDPNTCWDDWAAFILHAPGKWKGLIKRGLALSQLGVAAKAAVEDACKTVWQPVARAEGSVPSDWDHACLLCSLAFPSRQQWGAHAHRSHGYKSRHTLHAVGRGCTACGTVFANNKRLRNHLRDSGGCLALYEADQCTFAEVMGDGHVQAPPTSGSLRSRIQPSNLVCAAFFERLREVKPVSCATILDLARAHVAPFPDLRQALRQWRDEAGEDALQHAAQQALDIFQPDLLGCRTRSSGVFHDDFKFQPQLKPLPVLGFSSGKGFICCGVPPRVWTRARNLDTVAHDASCFWKCDLSNGDFSALFLSIPRPPCECDRIWLHGSTTLRKARHFQAWSSRLLCLLAHALRAAYAGAYVLIEAPGMMSAHFEPLFSWCIACGAGSSPESSAGFSFHFPPNS